MHFGIGTAQLGMDYGVANTTGRPSDQEVRDLFQAGLRYNLRLLDTAPAYGDSEARIGAHRPHGKEYSVVTKTRVGAAPSEYRDHLLASLTRLRMDRVHGLLLHDPKALMAPTASAAISALTSIRAEGLAERVGVSVYDSKQARRMLDLGGLDLIQVPFNVLDQRLLQDGTLHQLNEAGVEIHGRSVFLQGVLLMDAADLPAPLRALAPSVARFQQWCDRNDITRMEAAILAMGESDTIDICVLGVDNAAQLLEIMGVVGVQDRDRMDWSRFAHDDPSLLDPSNWDGS